jgi:hypothetical protein
MKHENDAERDQPDTAGLRPNQRLVEVNRVKPAKTISVMTSAGE